MAVIKKKKNCTAFCAYPPSKSKNEHVFPKGRVTDHRIGMTEHGAELFLEGEDKLNDMITALQSQHEAEALQELTSQYHTGKKGNR